MIDRTMSDAITRGIRVTVESEYRLEDSEPENSVYVFAYHVQISNHSESQVQLINRRWIITDAEGHREEVHCPGVFGQQPVIHPGETFKYSSFCPLRTPVGSMQGCYEMTTSDNQTFEAVIPPFTLAMPGSLH